MIQRFGALAFVAALVLGVPSAMAQEDGSPYTTIDPATPAGDDIQSLYKLIFWMAVVVFVLVQFLIAYAALRFRRRRSQTQRPAQIHGNKTLEITWTIIPAIILLIIAVPTITTLYDFDAQAEEGDLVVEVYGKQWWWEVHYPGLGPTNPIEGSDALVTANEIRVPVGTEVQFKVYSNNVIHAFWIPRFGGKMDVIPGHENVMTFTPTEVGTYYGECTEFCGAAHSWMRFVVKVQPQEEFDAWVDAWNQPPSSEVAQYVPDGNVTRAPAEFGKCLTCHAINGLTSGNGEPLENWAFGIGSDPTSVGAAPNLTLFGCRDTIAAGALENTPENLALWLSRPGDVKEGNYMANAPESINIGNGELTDAEIAVLVPYLQGLVPEGGCPEEGLGDTYNDGSVAGEAPDLQEINAQATSEAQAAATAAAEEATAEAQAATAEAEAAAAAPPEEAAPPAEGEAPAAGGETVRLVGGDLYFEPTELTVPVGGSIELYNEGQQFHNFAIETYNDDAPVDMPVGETVVWEVPDDLPPGEYIFYCEVPGHRPSMEGTITITE